MVRRAPERNHEIDDKLTSNSQLFKKEQCFQMKPETDENNGNRHVQYSNVI